MLESTEDGPVPPFRWRLPSRVHEHAWKTLSRLSQLGTRRSYDYGEILDELRARELRRVYLIHHPFLGHLSCETDVSLLERGGRDWMETDSAYLTDASFDWAVRIGHDDWDAYGW